MDIIIEEIELDSVLYYGKEKYNSNNHWDLQGKPQIMILIWKNAVHQNG